jgi:ABC-2 type transport system ATP-binding protein
MPILEVKNIVKTYANHVALDDVSISVETGSIFGLLGPNGAGKTSLIRIVNQITGPDKGEILFNGRKLKPEDISRIGYLPEERGLYKKMKVGEQVIYLAQLKGLSKSDARKKLKYWFEKFDIAAWWDKKIEELSKGMQQKIQFIVTILHEPELLIFDEPFSGFDPINTKILKNEILKLREDGATIIFSTHNMESVEELCDDIALINKSKKILSGKLSDIKKDYKPNIYNINFSDKPNFLELTLRHQYEILEKNTSSLKIKLLDDSLTTNQLIQSMLPFGNISSFSEEIPTMNDIFIQVVENVNE